MLQISPQKSFPIIWNGADPNDTDTLYVQAVVKDGLTLTTLSTVNLTDNGSHLFSNSYTAPHDPSQTGTGRWIIITITVYTDSGYTTKSANYERITEQYLVKQIVDATQMFGGFGGGFDYKEIRKIIKEELDQLMSKESEPIVFPSIPEPVDTASLIKSIVEPLTTKIDGIVIPEPPEQEKVELRPLEQAIQAVGKRVDALPKFKETDLSSVIRRVDNVATSMEDMYKEYKKGLDELRTLITEESSAKQMVTKLRSTIGEGNLNHSPARESYLAKLAAGLQ